MSIFCLKLIATICMLLDHIAYFFPNMPICFHWLGRLSAPIFVFGIVNSMEYTHAQHIYLLRLYLFSVIVSIFQTFTYIDLNIIRVLFTIGLLIYFFESRFTDAQKCKKIIVIYILYQIITCIVCELLIIYSAPPNEKYFIYLLPALLGSIFTMEGGLIWVSIGLLFYFFKSNKRKLTICYISMVALYEFCLSTNYVHAFISKIGHISLIGDCNIEEFLMLVFVAIIGFDPIGSGGDIFFEQYQWMMIFSLPFILCYNQKKGLKIKYAFYVFYILHIFILWWLTN